MMKFLRALPFVLLAITVARPAQAARSVYDLGAGMEYFAGKTEESLAPESGTLLRFGAQSGENIFRWVTNLMVTMGSGEADFDDQGTTRELTYKLMGGEFNLGFGIYPLGGDSKLSLQPYLTATGSAHLASISFDKDADVSDEFPKSDSSMMFGYALGVGADYWMSKEWGLKIHIERSQISGQLAGSTFGLSGHRMIIGLFFK